MMQEPEDGEREARGRANTREAGQADEGDQEGVGTDLHQRNIGMGYVEGGGAKARGVPVLKGTQASRHNQRRRGSVLWCDRCGAYSTQRVGARLRGDCQVTAMSRHWATRLARLREGRHPIHGKPLV